MDEEYPSFLCPAFITQTTEHPITLDINVGMGDYPGEHWQGHTAGSLEQQLAMELENPTLSETYYDAHPSLYNQNEWHLYHPSSSSSSSTSTSTPTSIFSSQTPSTTSTQTSPIDLRTLMQQLISGCQDFTRQVQKTYENSEETTNALHKSNETGITFSKEEYSYSSEKPPNFFGAFVEGIKTLKQMERILTPVLKQEIHLYTSEENIFEKMYNCLAKILAYFNQILEALIKDLSAYYRRPTEYRILNDSLFFQSNLLLCQVRHLLDKVFNFDHLFRPNTIRYDLENIIEMKDESDGAKLIYLFLNLFTRDTAPLLNAIMIYCWLLHLRNIYREDGYESGAIMKGIFGHDKFFNEGVFQSALYLESHLPQMFHFLLDDNIFELELITLKKGSEQLMSEVSPLLLTQTIEIEKIRLYTIIIVNMICEYQQVRYAPRLLNKFFKDLIFEKLENLREENNDEMVCEEEGEEQKEDYEYLNEEEQERYRQKLKTWFAAGLSLFNFNNEDEQSHGPKEDFFVDGLQDSILEDALNYLKTGSGLTWDKHMTNYVTLKILYNCIKRSTDFSFCIFTKEEIVKIYTYFNHIAWSEDFVKTYDSVLLNSKSNLLRIIKLFEN